MSKTNEELPKVMVFMFEPKLGHSHYVDLMHQKRTLKGLMKMLRDGVKSGDYVGYRLYWLERDVLGVE